MGLNETGVSRTPLSEQGLNLGDLTAKEGAVTLDDFTFISRGGDGTVISTSAPGEPVFFFVALNTSDVQHIMCNQNGSNGSPFAYVAQNGSGSSTVTNGVGSVTWYKDGSLIAQPATRGALSTLVATSTPLLMVLRCTGWPGVTMQMNRATASWTMPGAGILDSGLITEANVNAVADLDTLMSLLMAENGVS